MANHPHAAESAVLDMMLFRHKLATGQPVTLAEFDGFAEPLTRTVRVLTALETYARCGITRHSRDKLRDAGLDIAQNTIDTVLRIVPTRKRPHRVNGEGVA